jgi:hypothetical protein
MIDASQAPESSYRARYTHEMVRDAVKTYVLRRLFVEQKGCWIVGGAMAVFFIYLLLNGQRDWLTGLVGAVAALPILLAIIVWRAHSVNTVGRFSRMNEPVAEIIFDGTSLSFASELGSAQVPWSQLTEVWQRPGYWMIFFDKNQFNILPDENMPERLRQKLRHWVERSA